MSPWTKIALDNRPLDNCPSDKCLLGKTSLGQLSPDQNLGLNNLSYHVVSHSIHSFFCKMHFGSHSKVHQEEASGFFNFMFKHSLGMTHQSHRPSQNLTSYGFSRFFPFFLPADDSIWRKIHILQMLMDTCTEIFSPNS